MIELIFATYNAAKLAQLKFVVKSLQAPLRVVSAIERFGPSAHYTEQGQTAAMVARNGAKELSQRLGVPVLTEDTTFHVQALDGEPGVNAGAYLKEKGRKGILQALDSHDNRRATIVSAVAWATPEEETQTWTHVLRGLIPYRERWTPGMPDWVAPTRENPLGGGYNAIFIPDGSPQTLAQIPPEDAIQLGYREPNFCAAIAFVLDQR